MTNKIYKSGMQLSIEVDVFIAIDGDYYVAYCPALNLSSYGRSAQEATDSFKIELEIFVEETNRKGTLEKYLLQNGWNLQLHKYTPPVSVPNTSFKTIEQIRQPLILTV